MSALLQFTANSSVKLRVRSLGTFVELATQVSTRDGQTWEEVTLAPGEIKQLHSYLTTHLAGIPPADRPLG